MILNFLFVLDSILLFFITFIIETSEEVPKIISILTCPFSTNLRTNDGRKYI